MNTGLTETRGAGGRRGGFTLVEMMVVIGIIAILASIGLIMAGKALGQSKTAATKGLLHAIGTAMESFKNDFGDYPPLITRLDGGFENPPEATAPSAIVTPEMWGEKARLAGNLNTARLATQYSYKYARYWSEWSLAPYVLGVGDLNGDGDTDKDKLHLDDGNPGFGFRNPGEQYLAWTRVEQVSGQPKLVHEPPDEGPVYGPYIDPGSTRKFLERVPVVYNPSTKRIEATTSAQSNQYMYRFVDPWGNPIRYYRHWQTKDPTTDEATIDYAPIEIRSFKALEAEYEKDMTESDMGSDALVMRAPYMLLAAGDKPFSVNDAVAKEQYMVSPFGDVLQSESQGQQVIKYLQTNFDAPFPFVGSDSTLSDQEREQILRLMESNVRYAP